MPAALGVIGCGKMAYAIVAGLARNQWEYSRLLVYDPDQARSELFTREFSAQAVTAGEVVSRSQVVILAVKPAQIPAVLAETGKAWTDDKLLLSVAAGIKTSSLEGMLTSRPAVIRIMPNTPALIGQGISALCRGINAGDEDLALAQGIFACLGSAVIVNESLMDAVTALSGSGPGYIYLVAEAMIQAGINIGLDKNLARQLVLKTMAGSVAMMEETGLHPAQLKDDVTSPGGTTIAGIRQLEKHGLRRAFFDAVEKAFERSVQQGNK